MDDSRRALIVCYNNEHYNVAQWLYELRKEAKKPINFNNVGFKNIGLKYSEVAKYSNSLPRIRKWIHTLDSIKEI